MEADAECDMGGGVMVRGIGGGTCKYGNRVAASDIRGNESRDGDGAAEWGAGGKEESSRAEELIRGAGKPTAGTLWRVESKEASHNRVSHKSRVGAVNEDV